MGILILAPAKHRRAHDIYSLFVIFLVVDFVVWHKNETNIDNICAQMEPFTITFIKKISQILNTVLHTSFLSFFRALGAYLNELDFRLHPFQNLTFHNQRLNGTRSWQIFLSYSNLKYYFYCTKNRDKLAWYCCAVKRIESGDCFCSCKEGSYMFLQLL